MFQWIKSVVARILNWDRTQSFTCGSALDTPDLETRQTSGPQPSLSTSDLERSKAHLKRWEDERMFPYFDNAKPPRLTIGVGRNLSDKGIRPDESEFMFRNDLADAERVLGAYDWWADLDPVRRCVCLSMVHNVGPSFPAKWPKFDFAMSLEDHTAAAFELKDSTWFTQVGRRGPEIVEMMKTGEWLSDEVLEAG